MPIYVLIGVASYPKAPDNFEQIPVTAAAVVLRANLPTAAASTLISNPVTFGPLYFTAFHLGHWITGDATPPTAAGPAPQDNLSLWERIARLGKPLIIGLSIMAICVGTLTYVLINLVWRWRVRKRRKARLARSKPEC